MVVKAEKIQILDHNIINYKIWCNEVSDQLSHQGPKKDFCVARGFCAMHIGFLTILGPHITICRMTKLRANLVDDNQEDWSDNPTT